MVEATSLALVDLKSGTMSKSLTSLWYSSSPIASSSAQTTFARSLEEFKQKLTSRSRKRARIDTLPATRLQDVVDEVSRVQQQYEAKRNRSDAHKSIVAFSERVGHYGKVLDVMVQHHPEYVSLAWGAMKLVFGAVVEHERIGVTIVTALSDIGDALARADLAEELYPTDRMKETILSLNCHIITFLLRALDWYESSTLSCVWQSVARPAALRYDDILADIKRSVDNMTNLSFAGSQAEQRDMHEEFTQEQNTQNIFRSDVRNQLSEIQYQIQSSVQQKHQQGDFQAMQQQLETLTILVQQLCQHQVSSEQTLLQELITTKQDIKATQVTISHQLSQVQLVQAMSIISNQCSMDPKATYQYSLSLRRARGGAKSSPFWNWRQFQEWDRPAGCTSHFLEIRGSSREMIHLRGFCVNIIEQLLHSQVAVLWVLHTKNTTYNAFEVLKSLIHQALNLDSLSHTDTLLNSYLRAFNAAHHLNDYAILLAHVLTHFKLVYILIDATTLDSASGPEFHVSFQIVLDIVTQRGPRTVLKVLTVSPVGVPRSNTGPVKSRDEAVVVKLSPKSKKKLKSIPKVPLRRKPGSVLGGL